MDGTDHRPGEGQRKGEDRRPPRGLVAPSPSPAQRTQKRGAGTEQKAEVVPVSASRLVVEGELFPAAEDVDDKDDLGRKPVPEPPQ